MLLYYVFFIHVSEVCCGNAWSYVIVVIIIIVVVVIDILFILISTTTISIPQAAQVELLLIEYGIKIVMVLL